MFKATNGSNSHKGEVWILGLLVSAAALQVHDEVAAFQIAATAKEIASFADRATPRLVSHGDIVTKRYGATGARGEALGGFPRVVDIGLPTLRAKRAKGAPESVARLATLLRLMPRRQYPCLLYHQGQGAHFPTK